MSGTLLTIIQPAVALLVEYETANQSLDGDERAWWEGYAVARPASRALHQRAQTYRPSFNSNFYLYESCIIVSPSETALGPPPVRCVQLPLPLSLLCFVSFAELPLALGIIPWEIFSVEFPTTPCFIVASLRKGMIVSSVFDTRGVAGVFMFLGEIPWIWALEFMNESESHWKLCCVIKLCCWFTYSLWNVQCLLWYYQRVVKQRLYRYLRVDIQILYGQKIWLLYLTINLKLCRYGRKMGKE